MLSYFTEQFKERDYQEHTSSEEGVALPLNVYVPTVKNEYNDVAVVCIHGGAWTSNLTQSKPWEGNWMRHNASLLASLGYCAVEITHRSITSATLANVLSDLKKAFKAVKEVIMPRHGLTRLYAIGDSAGGHLTLMSAIFDELSLRPEKVVACNPVSDLTDPKWKLGNATDEERRAASPLYRSVKTDTEILILHGEEDKVVPIEFSHKLCAHMTSLGNRCTLVTLPEAVHAFILYGYTTPIEKVNEYMEMAVNFFK